MRVGRDLDFILAVTKSSLTGAKDLSQTLQETGWIFLMKCFSVNFHPIYDQHLHFQMHAQNMRLPMYILPGVSLASVSFHKPYSRGKH